MAFVQGREDIDVEEPCQKLVDKAGVLLMPGSYMMLQQIISV